MGKLLRIKDLILADLDTFKAFALQSTGIQNITDHYGLPRNGKYTKWVRSVLERVGVTEDLLKENLRRKKTLYPWIEKGCPTCQKAFQAQQGHPKEATYCSNTCANRAPEHLVRTEAQRQKTSQTLNARYAAEGRTGNRHRATQERECTHCRNPFLPALDKTRYCSQSCAANETAKNPEYREKLRQVQLRAIKEGRHKGWKSRAKVNISYAERFFMKVLGLNGIPYEREVPENGFFIDFAITLASGHKIALEIDGKQHKFPERAASDARKDEALRKAGWHVHRIPWCSINSDAGKQRMKALINGFLAVYQSLLNVDALKLD